MSNDPSFLTEDPNQGSRQEGQIQFCAGLLACREHMANLFDFHDPRIADAIRGTWFAGLEPDPGRPRALPFAEIIEQHGNRYVRRELDATVEALPIALGFLEAIYRSQPPPRYLPGEGAALPAMPRED